ncbi:hypothetical protein B484DRAFT_68476 [Ochromonadaceae sp. CCMP2298]|nr:hypothetical protein B484DRAFT_68476 [Ochromonadaceae sp. CCMP2298]
MSVCQVDVREFLTSKRLPGPPADFEGREVVMHEVIRNVLDRRLVSLVGEDGLGKSSVGAAVCAYLYEREKFRDAIVYFKAKGCTSYRQFLQGLQGALLLSTPHVAARARQLMESQRQEGGANLVYPEEEVVCACLEPLKLLLVLDHVDELMDCGDSHTDLRLLLGRLLEQCADVKLLVIDKDTLGMHNINVGFSIVEYSVPLKPLFLNHALQLFAKLAPSLSTSTARRQFITSLQPARQLPASANSKLVQRTAYAVRDLFGDGHPSRIVHMASESTAESVQALQLAGVAIIRTAMGVAQEGGGLGGGAGGVGGGAHMGSAVLPVTGAASVGNQTAASFVSHASASALSAPSKGSIPTTASTSTATDALFPLSLPLSPLSLLPPPPSPPSNPSRTSNAND